MKDIVSALNFTPDISTPVKGEEFIDPGKIASDLKAVDLTPKPTDPLAGIEEFQAKNKKLDFSPVTFNRDLYKRYTDSYFGNTVFLDPRYYDNEEINARRKGEWSDLAMGTIKAIPMFRASFSSFFRSAPWDYNNEHTRELADIMDRWETLFPSFYTKEEQMSKSPIKGILPFTTGWGNFWGDKLIKNIGFMAGAFVAAAATEAAVTAVTGGLGTVPMAAATAARFSMLMGRMKNGFTAANQLARNLALGEQGVLFAKTAQTLPKALQMMKNYTTGQRMIHGAKSMAMSFWAANAEASIESVGLQQTMFDNYLAKFRELNGRLPTPEEYKAIEDITMEAGNYQYALNTALIWGANMVQWGNLFKPTKLTKGIVGGQKTSQSFSRTILGGDQFIDATGKIVAKDKTTLGKIGSFFGGRKMLIDSFAEGTQEIMQFSFEKGAEELSQKYFNNYLEGTYDPKKRMVIGDMVMANIHGMKEAFGSKEGWESFFIGFLTGYPIHGMISTANRLKGNKSKTKAEKESIDAFNAFDLQDLMVESPQIQEFLERNRIAMNDLMAQQFISSQRQIAEENGDVFMMKNLNQDALINFVRTGMQLGKFDARVVQLETLKDLTDDAFESYFGMEYNEDNAKKANAFVDKTITKAKQMKEVIEAIDGSVPNEFDFRKEPQKWQASEMVKEVLIRNTLSLDDRNRRIPNVIQDILDINPDITTDMLDILSNPDDVNRIQQKYLNPLSEQVMMIQNTLEGLGALSGEERENAIKKIQRLLAHQKNVNEAVTRLNEINAKSNVAGKTVKELTEEERVALANDIDFQREQAFAAAAATKELLEEMLAFKISETETTSFEEAEKLYNMSKSNDILGSLIDLRRLQNSMKILLDENGNLQTPAGRKKAIEKYVDLHKYQEDNILELTRRASYKEFLKNPQASEEALRNNIQENEDELEVLRSQLTEAETLLVEKKEQLAESKKEAQKLNLEIFNAGTGAQNVELLEQQAQLMQQREELEALLYETEFDAPDFPAFKAALAELDSQLAELQAKIGETLSDKESRRNNLEDQIIPNLENEIAELEERIIALKDSIAELEKKNKELEALVESIKNNNPNPPSPEEIEDPSVNSQLAEELDVPKSEMEDFMESLHDTYLEDAPEPVRLFDARTNVQIFQDKINAVKQELKQRELNAVSNSDLLVYLHTLLQETYDNLSQKEKDLQRKLKNLQYDKNKMSKKKYEDKKKQLQQTLRIEARVAAQLSNDIHKRIREIQEQLTTDKEIAKDLAAKVQFYQSFLSSTKFVEGQAKMSLEKKIETTKKALKRVNYLIDKTEKWIDKIKRYLGEVLAEINKLIPLFKNYEKYFKDGKLDLDLVDGEYDSAEFKDLQSRLDSLFEHEEIDSANLEKAEALKKTLVEKSIKLQNELRWLQELQAEGLPFKTWISPPVLQQAVTEMVAEIQTIAEETKIETVDEILSEQERIQQEQDLEEKIGQIEEGHVLLQNQQALMATEFGFVDWGFYSYMKSTQRDDRDDREDKRSGIFESFVKVFNDREMLLEFLKTNNLKFVVRTIPSSFYDNKYFDAAFASQADNGEYVALFLTDALGNPVRVTKTIINGQVTGYELVPENAPESDENVFIVQSIPVNISPNQQKKGAATRRILFKETQEQAEKHMSDTMAELMELRQTIKENPETRVEMFIANTTPGKPIGVQVSSTPQSANHLKTNPHIRLNVPLTATDRRGFYMMPGALYMQLLDELGTDVYNIPVLMPQLISPEVKLGGKSVLDNLADILFVLHSATPESFEDTFDQITNGLFGEGTRNATPPTIQSLFEDFLYKPKSEKSAKIQIDKNTYVTINFSLRGRGVETKKQFFDIKRFEVDGQGKSKQVDSLRLEMDVKGKPKMSREDIGKKMQSVLKGVRLNVRSKYLDINKPTDFHYVLVKPDAKDPNKFEITSLPQEQLSYSDFLFDSGIQISALVPNTDKPFSTIGAGLLLRTSQASADETFSALQEEKERVQNQKAALKNKKEAVTDYYKSNLVTPDMVDKMKAKANQLVVDEILTQDQADELIGHIENLDSQRKQEIVTISVDEGKTKIRGRYYFHPLFGTQITVQETISTPEGTKTRFRILPKTKVTPQSSKKERDDFALRTKIYLKALGVVNLPFLKANRIEKFTYKVTVGGKEKTETRDIFIISNAKPGTPKTIDTFDIINVETGLPIFTTEGQKKIKDQALKEWQAQNMKAGTPQVVEPEVSVSQEDSVVKGDVGLNNERERLKTKLEKLEYKIPNSSGRIRLNKDGSFKEYGDYIDGVWNKDSDDINVGSIKSDYKKVKQLYDADIKLNDLINSKLSNDLVSLKEKLGGLKELKKAFKDFSFEQIGSTANLDMGIELFLKQALQFDKLEGVEKAVKEINAKYDAELDALEGAKLAEAPVSDIERRRGLNRNIEDNSKRKDLLRSDFFDGRYYHKGGEYYDTVDLDSFDLIKGSSFKEVDDLINAKYDAEYVDAVKKGEITKELAMQALEEAGRKDSDAYRELAALEQEPITEPTTFVEGEFEGEFEGGTGDFQEGITEYPEDINLEDLPSAEDFNPVELTPELLDHFNEIAELQGKQFPEQSFDVSDIEIDMMGQTIEEGNPIPDNLDEIGQQMGLPAETQPVSSSPQKVNVEPPQAPVQKKKFTTTDTDLSYAKESSKKMERIEAPEITPEQIKEVKAWFGDDVNIQELFNVANSQAWATWTASAITLYQGSNRSDLYHEAWHHFSQLYLTPEEKTKLYDEVRRQEPEFAEASDVDVEEHIAREFSKYALSNGKMKLGKLAERKSLFAKIWKFLSNFINKLRGKRDLSLHKLFQDLQTGNLKGYRKSTDNIMNSKLNSGINDVFTERESTKVFDKMDYLVAKVISTKGLALSTVLQSVNKENKEEKTKLWTDLLLQVRNELIAEYEGLFDENNVSIKGQEKLATNLEKMLTHYNDVIQGYRNNSRLVKTLMIEFEEDSEGNLVSKQETVSDDEKRTKDSASYQDASEKSWADIADPDIQKLMFTLPKMERNPDGSITLTKDVEFGEGKLEDPIKMVNILLDKLTGTTKDNLFGNESYTMMSKLKDLATEYPVVASHIIPQLELQKSNDGKATTQPSLNRLLFVARFAEAFTRPKNSIQVLSVERSERKDNLETPLAPNQYGYNFSRVISTKYQQASEKIRAAFLQYTPQQGDFVLQMPNGERQIPVKAIDAIKKQGTLIDAKNYISALKKIGIDVSLFNPKSINVEDVKQLYAEIAKELTKREKTKQEGISDIWGFITSGNTYATGVKMAESASKQGDSFLSNAYLNAENKLEQEVTQWSKINTLMAALNNSVKYPTYESLLQDSLFSYLGKTNFKNTNLYLQLFNLDGTRKVGATITVNNDNGVISKREVTDSDFSGKKTRKLHVAEKALKDINGFFAQPQQPRFVTMQLADKSSFYSLSLNSKLFGFPAPNKDQLFKAFKSALEREISIVRQYKAGDPELVKLDKLTKEIKSGDKYQFAVFKDILASKPELVDALLNTEANDTIALSDLLNQTEILEGLKDAIYDYFYDGQTGEIARFMAYMNVKLGDKPNGTKFSQYINAANYTPKQALGLFIVNQFLFNIEMSEIIFGNPYLHKDPFKRIAGASSTGAAPIMDNVFLQGMIDLQVPSQAERFRSWYKTMYNLSNVQLEKDSGLSPLERLKVTRFVTLKDQNVPSVYLDNIVAAVDANILELTKGKPFENLDKETKTRVKVLEAKRKEIISKYSKINEADAFGAMTLDFFRRSAIQMRFWNEDLESVYKKCVEWDYHNRAYKHYSMLSENEVSPTMQQKYMEMTADHLKQREAAAINPEEQMLVELTVQKFQYFGEVQNNTIYQAGFHKFELMPLIPQVIDGTKWEKHLERLMFEDIDYAVFESGSKLERDKVKDNFYEPGTETTTRKVENIHNLSDLYRSGKNSYQRIETGNMLYLKEQVKMDTAPHSEMLVFGSQIRKLVFNYFDRAEALTPEIATLYDEYKSIINNLIVTETDRVFKEAGIKQNPDGSIEVTDMNTFIGFIKGQLEKKTINKNVASYFILNPQGQLAKDIDVSLYRQQLESVLVSVINSRVVSQKTHGEMKVQVPSTGFEKDTPGIATLENGTNGLRSYYLDENKQIRKLQVKVALKGDFLNLLNREDVKQKSEELQVPRLSALNMLLKDKEWMEKNGKLVTMIGYRIPTQEHNSMEVMEIAEFLHPLAGSMIVVPTEITAKAGSDFDIDKMNTFLPNITPEGNLVGEEKLVYEELRERIDKLKTGKEQSWKIQSTKLQKLYDERKTRQAEIPREIAEIKHTLREINIEIAFLKKDILILKDLQKEPDETSKNRVLTIFDRGDLTGKSLEETISLKESKIKEFEQQTAQLQELMALSKQVVYQSPEERERIKKREETQAKYTEELEMLYSKLKGIRNYDKKSQQNRIIDIFSQIILQPSNFVDLVTPNSVFVYEDIMEEIVAIYYPELVVNGKPNFDVKATKMLSSLESYKKFESLLELKDALGIAAQANTFSQLLRQADVFIHQDKFDTLFSVHRDSEGNVLLGKATSVDFYPKSLTIGQFINLYVDAANDPRAGYVNTGLVTAPILFSLLHMGASPENIIAFLNQPIIREYANREGLKRNWTIVEVPKKVNYFANFVQEFTDRTKVSAIKIKVEKDGQLVDETISLKTLANMAMSDLVATLDTYLEQFPLKRGTESLKFSLEEEYLMTMIKNNKVFSENITDTDTSLRYFMVQLRMLAEYEKLDEAAKNIRELQSSVNYDTTKSLNASQAYSKMNDFTKVQASGYFGNVENLRYNSITSPFAVQDKIVALAEAFMPVTNSKAINQLIDEQLENLKLFSESDVKRFTNRFKNGLVSFIFQNFQTPEFKALFETIYGYKLDNFDDFYKDFLKNFSNEMVAFKTKHPELFKKYSLLDNLFVSPSRLDSSQKGIGLIFPEKSTNADNNYINQWNELLDEGSEVSLFMERLALFTFLQSGLSPSNISFTKIVDNTSLSLLLDFAKQEYTKTVKRLGERNMLMIYFAQFLANNNVFRQDRRSQEEKSIAMGPGPKSPKVNRLGIESFRGQLLTVPPQTFQTPLPTIQPTGPTILPVTGFQGYKGGFEDRGKGTPEGDGKDKAMREVATGAIVEFKTDKAKSSSLTTLETVGQDNAYSYEKDRYVGQSYNGVKNGKNNYGAVVMLARNGKLSSTKLSEDTKAEIKIAHNQGSEFVVGDMPGVDSQFIDYLQEIGAKFTVYHTGNTPRINISKPTTPTVSTEVKEFSEFGTQYRFVLENNIPVMGEYKQGGKDWQILNPKNVVSKYNSLLEKTSTSEVPGSVPAEPSFTTEEFEYQGQMYQINTRADGKKQVLQDGEIVSPYMTQTILKKLENSKIKPTEEQQKVIDDIVAFLQTPSQESPELFNPENIMMISGAGGTGKTFSITRAIEQAIEEKRKANPYSFAQGLKVVYGAPTHNARRELQSSLDDVFLGTEEAKTNASIFYIDYSPVTDRSSKREIDRKWTTPLFEVANVIILDEYSMLGGENWKMILERLQERKDLGKPAPKIIFTGDYAQIPPPGERKQYEDGEVTNMIFHKRKDRVRMLYTNMRAKYQDVADQSAKIRGYIDRVNAVVIYKTSSEKIEDIMAEFRKEFVEQKTESLNVKAYNTQNKSEWIENYFKAFNKFSKTNPKFGVIVSYNNAQHPNNIKLTNFIRTNIFGKEKAGAKFNEGELLIIENLELNVTKENGSTSTLGKDERVVISKIEKTVLKRNYQFNNKGDRTKRYFSIEVDAYKITATPDGKEKLTFYVPILSEPLVDLYRKKDFGFLNFKGEQPIKIEQLIALVDKDLGQTSYGYIVDSHKVQGSSYDQTWVWEDNILTARDPKELLQLLYTAYSRPKYKTHTLYSYANIKVDSKFEDYKGQTPKQSEVSEATSQLENMTTKLKEIESLEGLKKYFQTLDAESQAKFQSLFTERKNEIINEQDSCPF